MLLAPVRIKSTWSYIDTQGNVVLSSPQWQDVNVFSEGLAGVKILDKWGFIDTAGNLAILPKWEGVCAFHNGLCIVSVEHFPLGNTEPYTKYKYIDKKGFHPFLGEFWSATPFSDDGIACVEGPLSCIPRYINRSGLPCLPKIHPILPGEDLFAYCDKKTGKYGYRNLLMQTVIPPQYGYAYDFSHGLGRVMLNGKYGCIDSSGQIIAPFEYDYIQEFTNGMAIVTLNDKYGHIDTAGQLKVPCIYDYAKNFFNGLAAVIMNEKCGYVDTEGNLQIPCIYDNTLYFTETD